MSTQEKFDAEYITSTEICSTLNIDRVAVIMAVRRGKLPEPIRILRPNGGTHVTLWHRAAVTPVISNWHSSRAK